MDLSDALGEGSWPGGQQNNQQAGGAVWPGAQPNQPVWPGGPQPGQPAWPGQQPGAPAQPAWPGQQPGAPAQPAWPGQQPGAPAQPAWPGQPSQPGWPGQPSQPVWPGQPGQPSQPSQPSWPGPGQPGHPTAPQRSLTVPYDMNLPNGCFDKLLITVNGMVKPNANKITVNLIKGKDVAFHFNPRFNEDGRKAIVRNSLLGSKWGKEEREHKLFPFTAGQPFEMKLLCNANEFRVAVNKAHLLEFKHRVRDIHNIRSLSIHGDIELFAVELDKLH